MSFAYNQPWLELLSMFILSHFLAECLTPVPISWPAAGHKSHANHLQVDARPFRRLEHMHVLSEELNYMVESWIQEYLPSMDPRSNPQLHNLLHSQSTSVVDGPPGSLEEVSSLLNFPLNLVSLVLHEIFPDTQNYGFTSDDDEGQDSGLLQYFSYKLEHASASQLLVICQSPQVLSDKDIEMFVKCRTFPPYRHMGYAFPEKLDSEHRLWGKIWDLCAKQHARWFVLTSYNFWVFGAFSEGWTTAFVSNAVRCDSNRPSVATFLLFWLASAIHRDGAAQVPKVPEPTNNRFTPVSIPVLGHANFINAADSESHWDGKSDDFTSFASIQLSDTGSYASNHPAGGDTSYRNSLRAPLLASWLNNTQLQYAPATIGLEPHEGIQRIDRSPQKTSFGLGEWLI